MKPVLTIAIPTWNNFKQLTDCVYTLLAYVEFPMKVVVVNNGPEVDAQGAVFKDQLKNALGSYAHLVDVIQAESNLGWMGGINKAFVEACETPLFGMLNDDLVFLPGQSDFLMNLCKYFQFPEVGAVGPCTNFVMGSQNLWVHTTCPVFETTLLIGFCLIVRSSAFSELGGLDEGLPGGDDLDLSILLRKAGYRMIVDRTCYVHHIGAQTGARVHDYWNSQEHVNVTNNALIRKHGVKAWYECIQAKARSFEPIVQTDSEGDKIRELLHDSGIREDSRGLDVGCGGNKTVNFAVGVDRDKPGERGASGGRKFSASEADMVADILDLPLDDDSQEFIIARHVLEHLVDPVEAIEEWTRVLRPGGLLVIAVPDESVAETIKLDWEHKHAFTPASLVRILDYIGYVDIDYFTIRPGISFVVRAQKPTAKQERAFA